MDPEDNPRRWYDVRLEHLEMVLPHFSAELVTKRGVCHVQRGVAIYELQAVGDGFILGEAIYSMCTDLGIDVLALYVRLARGADAVSNAD